MSRPEPTHLITKSFAFGSPNKQYRRGSKVILSGDTKDFAALNRCAVMIKSDEPVVEGSNAAP